MDRYVIKNCEQIHSADNFCWNKNVFCQDCTDCIMKQIVESCKSACIDCSSIKRVTYTLCKDLNNCKTAKILQLLDIQEVE